MDYIEKIHKPSKGVGKITTVLFMLAILGSPMFSASLSACDITNADIWAGHTSGDASAKNHSPDSKLYEKKSTTVYFYAECVAERGDSGDESEDIRWVFNFGDGSSTTLYTLNSTSSGTKTKTTSHSYSDTDNCTVSVSVDRGHYTGTWESASPGATASDTCKVTIFDVDITTPSSFPEYVCINGNLSLGSTVYPADTNSAGTFSWSKVGPGTVTFTSSTSEDPNFSANQTGNYTAKVEFTIDDSPGGCTESPITVSDTSGTIGVGDVDITGFTPASPYQVGSLSGATSMGSDVVVSYTISEASFVADSAILEVRDTNGTLVHSDSGISHSGGTNTATWSVSTTSLRSVNSLKSPYEIKIRMLAGGTECSDTTSMSVIASTASVVAESSITQCMEGRWVTFTATAEGFVSTSPGNNIDFTFHFQTAAGTPWTATDWSFDLEEDHIAVASNVLANDADHYFDTPIYVTVADNFTHTATSSTISIRVYELWIDYFRDNTSSKDWKVVVNKNIAYNAIASSDCTNWAWDMADGFPDCWNPTGGSAKTGTTMKIPNSDLPSSGNWDHFGKAYGTIKVFCEDGEDNNHTFYSTSMYTSDFPAGWGTKKAEVYFDPGRNITGGTTINNSNPPCWFEYWNETSAGDSAIEYDHSLVSPTLGATGFTYNIVTNQIISVGAPRVGRDADGSVTMGGPSSTNHGTMNAGVATGIDCFHAVVKHEKLHYTDFTAGIGQANADLDFIVATLEIDENSDGDMIDPGETDPGTLDTHSITCPSTDNDDKEYRTYYRNANVWNADVGNYDDVDWSTGGKQW